MTPDQAASRLAMQAVAASGIPPYVCVKCEARDSDVYTRWHAEGPTCGMESCTSHERKAERLEHTCRRCGFAWTTETADKAAF